MTFNRLLEMAKITSLLLFGLMFVHLHGLALKDQKGEIPEYIECTSNGDCAPGYCCTICKCIKIILFTLKKIAQI